MPAHEAAMLTTTHDFSIRQVGRRMVAAAAWRAAAACPALRRGAAGSRDRCRARKRLAALHGHGRAAISCSGRPRRVLLVACDPSIEDGLAFATGRSVEHASWLHPCVRGELRTGTVRPMHRVGRHGDRGRSIDCRRLSWSSSLKRIDMLTCSVCVKLVVGC